MRCSVTSQDGSPAFLLDGKKTPPILFSLSDFPAAAGNTAYAQKNMAAFAKQGIRVMAVDACLQTTWHKHDPFEPDPIIAAVCCVQRAAPEAGVFLRLHLNPPYWWLRDNPEETVCYRTPEGDKAGIDDGEQSRLIKHDADGHLRASLASEKWLREAGEKLALLCRALRQSPAGELLVGIQLACGIYGEWHQWGVDCSAPMQNRFRRFLREKYPTDADLQAGWHDPSVTHATAVFHPEPFRPGDDGCFRDPQKTQFVTDAQQCVQTTTVEAICHFSKIVKREWPDMAVGAFYGYYLNNVLPQPICGHLQMNDIFKNRESIDFLCGPFPYMENRLTPQGVPLQRGLLESVRLNGMLWLTEMDEHPVGTENFVGGDPAQRPQTVARLRRNVLQPLAAGQGLWFYDHRVVPGLILPQSTNNTAASIWIKDGWWDEPSLMKEIGGLYRLGERMLQKPYQPAADFLMVFDPEANYRITADPVPEYPLMEAVARSGVAYDCIYLQDLEKAELERYKAVLFANAYCLTPRQREKIQTLTRGKLCIWLYAPGYCDGETLCVKHIAQVTGMQVAVCAGQADCRFTPAFGGQAAALSEQSLSPAFHITDSAAQVISTGKDGSVTAAKKDNQVFFALPVLSAPAMRILLREAGCHIYTESGDPILAGGGIVAVNSYTGGRQTLTLRNGSKLHLQLAPCTTAVFDSESGERLL